MSAKRIEVSESAVSTASQEEVFELLVDGSTWPLWSPISSFQLHAPAEGGGEGVGAVRAFKSGLFVSYEEIVRVDAPSVFGYRLVASKVLHMREYQAEVRLEPHADGTGITWAGSFMPLVPGTGWIWKRIVAHLYRQFSAGLASHAERGLGRSPRR